MRRLRFTTAAYNNIAEIGIYVAETSGEPKIGDRMITQVVSQCQKMAKLTGTLGRIRPELGDGIRSFPFRNHIIYFRYLGSEFEVVAVLHSHRDTDSYFKEHPL